MGTYTANKNLYMPSVGETGWGTLMNTNLSTIDNFLKPITVSGSTYTFTGNHVGNQSGGTITATKITNSGTLTNAGKITGNGGIAGTTGTFSGAVTGTSFNGMLKKSGVYTVTPTSSTMGYIPYNDDRAPSVTLLPPSPNGVKYSGSINFIYTLGTSGATVYYYNGVDIVFQNFVANNTATSLTFSNIPYLIVSGATRSISYYGFTLS